MTPIETEYNGVKFRSRLEARWAAFLDELGCKWFYEWEGFSHNGTAYLPDFWLPTVTLRGDVEESRAGVYLEIKPSGWGTVDERALAANRPVVMFAGPPPGHGDYDIHGEGGWQQTSWGHEEAGEELGKDKLFQYWDNCMLFEMCRNCNHVQIDYDNYYECHKCGGPVDTGGHDYDPLNDHITASARVANTKRFWK